MLKYLTTLLSLASKNLCCQVLVMIFYFLIFAESTFFPVLRFVKNTGVFCQASAQISVLVGVNLHRPESMNFYFKTLKVLRKGKFMLCVKGRKNLLQGVVSKSCKSQNQFQQWNPSYQLLKMTIRQNNYAIVGGMSALNADPYLPTITKKTLLYLLLFSCSTPLDPFYASSQPLT